MSCVVVGRRKAVEAPARDTKDSARESPLTSGAREIAGGPTIEDGLMGSFPE